MAKRRKLSECHQLTLVELKEQKKPWNYDHPEHTKVTKRIAEMIAIDSQPFSIVEDTGFVRLMKHTCPRYIVPSRKYFSENIIPEMYANLRQRLFEDIHSDDNFSISFTSIDPLMTATSSNQNCNLLILMIAPLAQTTITVLVAVKKERVLVFGIAAKML